MAYRVPIPASASGGPFTPREREVVRLLARRLDVPQIARVLFASESTTRTHVASLFGKLGVTHLADALLAAGRLGLLDDDDDGGAFVPARPSPRPPLPPRAAALEPPRAGDDRVR